MRGTVLYGTGDFRFEDTPEPKITKPTVTNLLRPHVKGCVSRKLLSDR